jgi:hypothetical protein
VRLLDARDPRLPLACGLAVTAVLAVASYAWTLRLELIGADTLPLIAESRVRSVGDLVRALTGPVMGARNPVVEFYRPASQALFVGETALFGLEPLGYHVVGLLAHLACGAMTILLARSFTGDLGIAALAGAIFVIHPAVVASVPFPSRIQDVLATAFGLGALLAHERVLRSAAPARWIVVGLLAALAMLAKESGLLFAGLVVLSHVLRGTDRLPRRAGVVLAWLLSVLLPALWLRFEALGEPGGYRIGAFRIGSPPPDYGSAFFRLQATPLGLVGTFLQCILDPARTLGIWGAFVAAAPLLGLPALRGLRARGAFLFAWILALLGAHAYLAFLHDKRFPLLPWYVYLALPAVSILLAASLVRGVRDLRRVWPAGVVAGAVLIVGAQLLSSPLLRRYGVVEVGSSLHARYFESLDALLRSAGRPAGAIAPGPMPLVVNSPEFFVRGNMLFVGPWTVEAWLELVHPGIAARVAPPGAVLSATGDLVVRSAAEWVELDRAGRVADRLTISWDLRGAQEHEELRPLEEAVRASPEDAQAWVRLGEAYRKREMFERAQEALRRAVALQPDLWPARYALAQVYAKSGRMRRAEEELGEVLRLNPGFGPAQRGLDRIRALRGAGEEEAGRAR